VTHGISYLPYVDQIVVLKDGVITESGTYEELMRNRGAFAEFLMEQLQEYDSNSSASDSERDVLRRRISESLDPLGELMNSPRKLMATKQFTKSGKYFVSAKICQYCFNEKLI